MRILIDCDVPAFINSGMGVGLRGLLTELFQHKEMEFHCIFSSDAPRYGWIASLSQFRNVFVHFAQETKRMRNIRELAGCASCLSDFAGLRADVSLLLHPVLPHKLDAPYLCIVYDLSSVRRDTPSSVPWHGRLLARRSLKACIRENARFLAISNFTRADLAEWAGMNERNIGLLHLGIDSAWFQQLLPPQIDKARSKFLLSAPYFCWSGEISGRKNVGGLLHAYVRAYRECGDRLPNLLLIGRTGRDGRDIDTLPARLGIGHKVHRIREFLSLDTLIALVSGAEGYIFPSCYEGFGLPVVEALARGVPVVVSNRTSLPEVAGPNALIFDFSNLESLKECLLKLAFEGGIQARTRSEGPLWAHRFSHTAAAAALHREIVQAIGSSELRCAS
jgi:glycosyltransferase involved in cell wall biosynthesis